MNEEPVAISGGIMAVFVAGFALVVEFGVDLTDTQVAVSLGFISAIIALVTIFQRSRVTPVSAARRAALDNEPNPNGPLV